MDYKKDVGNFKEDDIPTTSEWIMQSIYGKTIIITDLKNNIWSKIQIKK
jgi:hypothetical protein